METLLESSETVEKVPKQIFGRDAEKNDLTECPRINDLTITRGHETPQKYPLFYTKGFFDRVSRKRNSMSKCLATICREDKKRQDRDDPALINFLKLRRLDFKNFTHFFIHLGPIAAINVCVNSKVLFCTLKYLSVAGHPPEVIILPSWTGARPL